MCRDPLGVEWQHRQLGRWPAHEAAEQQDLLGLLGAERLLVGLVGTAREACLDLHERAPAWRQRPNFADEAAGDEEAGSPAGLGRGSDEARPQLAQPRQALEALDYRLQCLDPVAQPGRLLVAQALGQVREPGAKPRQRTAVEQARELLVAGRRQRAGGQAGLAAAADRPE